MSAVKHAVITSFISKTTDISLPNGIVFMVFNFIKKKEPGL